jgi:DNA (cytosine-5)-methyltransferase 1
MKAYYNEYDPYAAEWLRNLIACGAIAPGIVDERSISDVAPADLDGFTQCHFFAGIGIWSAALRAAGWPDDRPVWTGSCPCQPFSAAGQSAGFDDERHLWPHWHWLIEQCRPETVFGEQVASADGLVWADLVSSDLEATDYALGLADTCAAGFRSFHIRQRLYFAAEDNKSAKREAWADTARRYGGLVNSLGAGLERHCGHVADRSEPGWLDARPHRSIAEASAACGLDNPHGARYVPEGKRSEGQARDKTRVCGPECRCCYGGLADSAGGGRGKERQDARRIGEGNRTQGSATGSDTGCAHDRLADAENSGSDSGRGLHIKDKGRGRPESCDKRTADRLADTDGRDTGAERQQRGGELGLQPQSGGRSERLADTGRGSIQRDVQRGDNASAPGKTETQTRQQQWRGPDDRVSVTTDRLANADGNRSPEHEPEQRHGPRRDTAAPDAAISTSDLFADVIADPIDGYWRDADWLWCRDGVWRPVEPSTFPLASTAPSRLGRLRAYGNGLDLAQATGFVRAYMTRDLAKPMAGDLFEWGI